MEFVREFRRSTERHRLDPDAETVPGKEAQREPTPGKWTQVERALGLHDGRALWSDEAERPEPGRHTLAGDAGDAKPAPLGFDDYRVLGLRDVLQQLGSEPALRQATIAAAAGADRSVAGRATRWGDLRSGAATKEGEALRQAAERHAVTLYRKATGERAIDPADPALAAALAQRGGGQPLPAELRRQLEHELAISLSCDGVAAAAARAVSAEAFTVGEDIFFADQAFAPETAAGRKLLAHELAHVAQTQRGDGGPAHSGVRVSQPGDPLEREADAVASRFDHGSRRPSAALGLALQGTQAALPHGAEMQRRFGAQPLGVRCFVGPHAKEACRLVDAEAFSVGNVLVFATDAPPVEVVAHELAHALISGHQAPDPAESLEMTERGDHDEQHAARLAHGGAARGAHGALGGEVTAKTRPKLARYEAIRPHGFEVAVQLYANADRLGGPIDYLGAGTRVVRTGATSPTSSYVEIRVTTGPKMNVQGWVHGVHELEVLPETTAIPLQRAIELFHELARAKIPGSNLPIPYFYPSDGCYFRAHLMARLLEEKGYASEKVFAVSRKAPGGPGGVGRGGAPMAPGFGLQVHTNYAPDCPQGQNPVVNWWYHVAPIIRVRLDTGQTESRVIDPSIQSCVETVDQWVGRMSSENFQTMQLAQIQNELNAATNPTHQFAQGPNKIYVADRNTYNPEDARQPRTTGDADQQFQNDQVKAQLYAVLEQYYELAAQLRALLAFAPGSSAEILARLRQANATDPRLLAIFFGVHHTQVTETRFPNLYADVLARVDQHGIRPQIEALVQGSQQVINHQLLLQLLALLGTPTTHSVGHI
jgi:hypothetical protein